MNSLKKIVILAAILAVSCLMLCMSVSANLFDGSVVPTGTESETGEGAGGSSEEPLLQEQKETLPVLYASVNTDVTDDNGSLRFDVSLEPGEESDFMIEFPESLSRNEGKLQIPAAESVVREKYTQIPTFFQEDYPDALYGGETVKSCGSSVTVLAMLASYLTGYTYQPDELARCFAAKADTDIDRISYVLEALGLPFEIYEAWEKTEVLPDDEVLQENETLQETEVRKSVFDALQEGKYAIVQMQGNSLFSEKDHFIILVGVTDEGKILVKDPLNANSRKENLAESFQSGFEESAISADAGYTWILDPTAVPEDIARYSESAQIGEEKRYVSLKLTSSEKQFFARLLYVNAYGECAEGQQALIEVILNQLLSEDFPNTLKELVYGENGLCEISLLNQAKPGRQEYLAVEKAIHGPYILEENVTDFSYICHKG